MAIRGRPRFGGAQARDLGGFGLPTLARPPIKMSPPPMMPPAPPPMMPPAPPMMPPAQIEQIKQIIPQLPPEKIMEIIPQLPPEVLPEVIPQLPPEIIPQVIPQLPPEIIPQVIPRLPPEIVQQLPPEIVADPVTAAVNTAVGKGKLPSMPPPPGESPIVPIPNASPVTPEQEALIAEMTQPRSPDEAPTTVGASSSADLGPFGTSGVSTMDSPPVNMGGEKPIISIPNASPPPAVDPATAAVETALSQLITEYMGGNNPYRADYDIDGDGENSVRDVMYQQQIEQGVRNPDPSTWTDAATAPEVDPATAAVDTATAATAITPESIIQYIGELGPFAEGMDVNGDGTVDRLDAQYLQQIEQGLRNPDGTPVPQLDPGITPQSIIQYAGEVGPFIEGMDINGDGTVDVLDAQQLSQSNPEKYPLPETQPDPVTPAVDPVQDAVDTAVGGGVLPGGNEPGERDVGVRDTTVGSDSVATTQEVVDAVDAPITNAEGDVFVDTSAAEALAAQNERDRLAAEQTERDRLAAEQAAAAQAEADATTAAEALAAQKELDRIAAEQAAADKIAAEQAAADKIAAEQAAADKIAADLAAADAIDATNPPGLPGDKEPVELDIDINDPNAPPVTTVDTTTAVDTSQTDVVDTTTAVTDMTATVNQTPTDWWSQWGYTTEQEAIDSTKFQPITGLDGVVAWVPKGLPSDEKPSLPVGDTVIDPNAPVIDTTTTTTGWWTGYGYTTEQEAIATGLFEQDPTTGVWGPKPAVDDNLPAEGWWVQHNFPDEATAIASDLFEQDPTTGVWSLIPPATGGEGWWVQHNFATEQEAIASNLFEQDPTTGVWTLIPADNQTTTGWWTAHNFATEQEAIASDLFEQDATGAWVLKPAPGGEDTATTGMTQEEIDAIIANYQAQQEQAAQNYVVDGSAMGYNPYMSGQYQSNPYGNAGVPDMGGITSIPVPAPLQNFEQPQDQPSAMELFNAGYQSPRTTTST